MSVKNLIETAVQLQEVRETFPIKVQGLQTSLDEIQGSLEAWSKIWQPHKEVPPSVMEMLYDSYWRGKKSDEAGHVAGGVLADFRAIEEGARQLQKLVEKHRADSKVLVMAIDVARLNQIETSLEILKQDLAKLERKSMHLLRMEHDGLGESKGKANRKIQSLQHKAYLLGLVGSSKLDSFLVDQLGAQYPLSKFESELQQYAQDVSIDILPGVLERQRHAALAAKVSSGTVHYAHLRPTQDENDEPDPPKQAIPASPDPAELPTTAIAPSTHPAERPTTTKIPASTDPADLTRGAEVISGTRLKDGSEAEDKTRQHRGSVTSVDALNVARSVLLQIQAVPTVNIPYSGERAASVASALPRLLSSNSQPSILVPNPATRGWQGVTLEHFKSELSTFSRRRSGYSHTLNLSPGHMSREKRIAISFKLVQSMILMRCHGW